MTKQDTTCTICCRAIYLHHADAQGRCCFCDGRPVWAKPVTTAVPTAPVVTVPAPRPAPAPSHVMKQRGSVRCPDIKGWFHHEAVMLPMLQQERPLVAVEIGTYRGASAIPQALTMRAWGGRLVCIDPWIDFPGSYEQMQANIVEHGVANCELWRMTSLEGAERWAGEEREPPEWVYVDGDHTEAAVTADLTAWWTVLAPGGLILGDDYGNPDYRGVTAAWNAFGRTRRLQTSGGVNGWGLVWIRKEEPSLSLLRRPVGIVGQAEAAA